MSRQTLSVRASRAISFARSTPETMSEIEWPTTLCFSRRSGESMRDADHAAAIECTAGQPLVLLDPEEGLVPFLLRTFDCLRRLASKP
jgi:hypothetical protein